jgi:hypothetical protein
MKIISFLLENIYWVIVVGGVLFSMFGRSGAKRRTNRMPSFGGGNEPNRPAGRQNPEWEAEDEELDYPGAYPAQRPVSQEPVSSMPPYQPQKPLITSSSLQGSTSEGNRSQTLERAVQAAASRPSEPPRARLAAAKPQPAAAAADSRTELATPKADELRKAIVWAEILGPPRSKRPFGK